MVFIKKMIIVLKEFEIDLIGLIMQGII